MKLEWSNDMIDFADMIVANFPRLKYSWNRDPQLP